MRLFHLPMKKLSRSCFAVVLALGLVLATVSCGSKAAELIVGKWAHAGKGTLSGGNKETLAFTRDGKMIAEENGAKQEMGTYAVVGGNTIKLNLPGVPVPVECDVAFPSDKEMLLTARLPKDLPKGITPPKIEADRFTRVSN
jgi:hypothetical protein